MPPPLLAEAELLGGSARHVELALAAVGAGVGHSQHGGVAGLGIVGEDDGAVRQQWAWRRYRGDRDEKRRLSWSVRRGSEGRDGSCRSRRRAGSRASLRACPVCASVPTRWQSPRGSSSECQETLHPAVGTAAAPTRKRRAGAGQQRKPPTCGKIRSCSTQQTVLPWHVARPRSAKIRFPTCETTVANV